jgi:putative lipoprotein (rSAM/lipoprotein system)
VYKRIVTVCLFVFGVGTTTPACGDDSCEDCGDLYTYHADGKVVAASSGQAIAGIQVAIRGWGSWDKTTISDAQGQWTLETTSWGKEGSMPLVAEDIDGEANGGTFKQATLSVPMVAREQGAFSGEGLAYEQHGVLLVMDPAPATDSGLSDATAD